MTDHATLRVSNMRAHGDAGTVCIAVFNRRHDGIVFLSYDQDAFLLLLGVECPGKIHALADFVEQAFHGLGEQVVTAGARNVQVELQIGRFADTSLVDRRIEVSVRPS